jgi:hypothetical protein
LFGGLILKVYGGKSTTRIHVLQEQWVDVHFQLLLHSYSELWVT